MTKEQKGIFRRFDYYFSRFKSMPMALYGLGIHTRNILEQAIDYNIVGIVANERIGERLYGREVMSVDVIENQVKIIVIVAQPKSVRTIYSRICHLESRGIEIYDIYGARCGKYHNQHLEIKHNQYWDLCFDRLKEAIDRYEIVSFDLYDALVMRKVPSIECLWDMMDTELKEEGSELDFKYERQRAEQQLIGQGVLPTIEQIYRRLLDNNQKLTLQQSWSLMHRELLLEKRFVAPRDSVVDAFRYARQQGKRIYILADIHLTTRIILDLLLQCNIEEVEESCILVSCEQQRSKRDGSLYELLAQIAGEGRILHVGSLSLADLQMVESYGIDVCCLMSAYEMITASSAGRAMEQPLKLMEKVMTGLFATRSFSDPFALSSTRGFLHFADMRQLGYSCFAPMTVAFMAWLIRTFQNHAGSAILFSSRDGYFLYRQYQLFRQQHLYLGLPEGIYFYISRRAATVASIWTEEDIVNIVRSIFTLSRGSLIELLKQRLGIAFDPADRLLNRSVSELREEDQEAIVARVLDMKSLILDNAKVERNNYLNYLQSLNLGSFDRIYLFDLYTKGTGRAALSKIMNRPIDLICYGVKDYPNAFISTMEGVYSMITEDQSWSFSWFERCYQLFEIIYSSLEGQLRCFDEAGRPLFVENSKYNAQTIKEAQTGVLEYIQDLEQLDGKWYERETRPEWLDSTIRLLASAKVSEHIRHGFMYYDSFATESPLNMWDIIV